MYKMREIPSQCLFLRPTKTIDSVSSNSQPREPKCLSTDGNKDMLECLLNFELREDHSNTSDSLIKIKIKSNMAEYMCNLGVRG